MLEGDQCHSHPTQPTLGLPQQHKPTHLPCDLQQRLFISAERNFLVAKSLPGGRGKILLFISQALCKEEKPFERQPQQPGSAFHCLLGGF